MSKAFDVVVLGAGPGGYVAAIRASPTWKKVAIIEEDKLGGVCLKIEVVFQLRHCLSQLTAFTEVSDMKNLGINVSLDSLDAAVAVKRAIKISDRISKGVGFLMKKNNIEVINGRGVLKDKKTIEVLRLLVMSL